jgi:hypothetical protein
MFDERGVQDGCSAGEDKSMSKIGLALGLMMVVLATAGRANATDISARGISIREGGKLTHRQVRVSSRDAAILLPNGVTPSAAIHVYSANDDFCFKMQAGTGWTNDGSSWAYADEGTGNVASVTNGKLVMNLKSGVAYSLNDAPQAEVNVQVQFGDGQRYCLHCNGIEIIQNDARRYSGKYCSSSVCDAEPESCDPLVEYDWREWPVSEGGNGHFYAVTAPYGTWYESRDKAIAAGGHLVTINDAAENDWLRQQYGTPGQFGQGLWTGFNDLGTEGHWEWVGGDGGWWENGNPASTSYANWYQGTPEPNGGLGENAMIINYSDYSGDNRHGTWTDADENRTDFKGGIIELDGPP